MKVVNGIFIFFPLLILMPIIALTIKNNWAKFKGEKKKRPWRAISILLVMCGVVIAFNISLYNFTINYQPRLVAERLSIIFLNRVEGKIDIEKYSQRIEKAGLNGSGYIPPEDEAIVEEGFNREKYALSLSKKIYKGSTEDIITIYAMYNGKTGKVYTAIELENEGNRWKVLSHKLVTKEELDIIDIHINFYSVKL